MYLGIIQLQILGLIEQSPVNTIVLNKSLLRTSESSSESLLPVSCRAALLTSVLESPFLIYHAFLLLCKLLQFGMSEEGCMECKLFRDPVCLKTFFYSPRTLDGQCGYIIPGWKYFFLESKRYFSIVF